MRKNENMEREDGITIDGVDYCEYEIGMITEFASLDDTITVNDKVRDLNYYIEHLRESDCGGIPMKDLKNIQMHIKMPLDVANHDLTDFHKKIQVYMTGLKEL